MERFGMGADYPDPQTFIDVLFRSDSSINYGSYNNKNVDDFIYQAQIEQDTIIDIKDITKQNKSS